MAQESLKATRDDDIFESGEMQNYFGNSAPEQDVLLDLLGCMAEIPTGGDSGLPHPPPFGEPIPSTSAPTSSSAFSRGAADADSGAHMFTSSHVHKLHYKPQFKMSKLSSSGGSSTGADRAAPNLSGMTKAGMARMMKNGVVNADVVKKQARADLGMTCSAGSDEDDASEDDEEVGSSGEIED